MHLSYDQPLQYEILGRSFFVHQKLIENTIRNIRFIDMWEKIFFKIGPSNRNDLNLQSVCVHNLKQVL